MGTGPRAARRAAHWLLLPVAGLSLALAVVGIFVPVLPTVPFILLAAWAAGRSSPRLERALLGHPHFGPVIRDWQHSGVVRRPAKQAATLAMSLSATSLLVLVRNPWLAAAALACMAAVLAWLWRRPEKSPP